jgi:hypothetical protein
MELASDARVVDFLPYGLEAEIHDEHLAGIFSRSHGRLDADHDLAGDQSRR